MYRDMYRYIYIYIMIIILLLLIIIMTYSVHLSRSATPARGARISSCILLDQHTIIILYIKYTSSVYIIVYRQYVLHLISIQ